MLFTFHFSLLTFHSSLFTLHYSLFTVHSSLFTLHFLGLSRSQRVANSKRGPRRCFQFMQQDWWWSAFGDDFAGNANFFGLPLILLFQHFSFFTPAGVQDRMTEVVNDECLTFTKNFDAFLG
jgi:hypothetical protein